MLKAKEYISANIKKMQKRVLLSKYDYGIFHMSMPIKLSKQNVDNYTAYKESRKIGLILNNVNVLNMQNTNAVFDKKIALSKINYENIIIKLNKPENSKYAIWLSLLEEFIIPLSPSMILIPLNSEYNAELQKYCNVIIQELNAILFPYTMSTEIVIHQKNEPISSLSYIIQNIAYPSKVSLCLNLDSIEKSYYTLKDIEEDIIKYDIQNSISIIQTNKYSSEDKDFLQFIKVLKDDIIVFGEKI